jgi:hypothetical protein
MKSKSIFLFLIALVFGAHCCTPKGDGSISEFLLNGNKMYVFSLSNLKSENVITVPLSSLVEDFILVHLETKEEAYFSPHFTTVSEKYIGIRDRRREPYKLFDRSGNFLCNVSSHGRGPGEYFISLYDDIIDDKNELIYLVSMTGNKILVYSTSGKFIKDIAVPQNLQYPKMFLADDVLTVVHLPFPNDKIIAFRFDVNTGEVLNELAAPAHLFNVREEFGMAEIFNTRNARGIFDVLYTTSDTLYHFDLKNNRFLPFFVLTHGLPENTWSQYFQMNKELIFTWKNGKLLATDLKNKTSSYINVVNDYFGNIPAPVSVVHCRNGYWVHNVQPEELIENIENRLAESACTENDRQVLNRTLSTLKEGTNNVVFIGKLKSGLTAKLW